MNPTAARSLALAALTILVGHSATAQLPGTSPSTARTPAAEAVSLKAVWLIPTLTAADRERLSATIRRADTLVVESKLVEASKLEEASRLYWSVVSEQHAVQDYPVTALRRLAVMYFNVGDNYAAASVLTELAESASEFGDPATRLQSLYEAALMYRDAARSDRVLECVRQIRPLLKSVAIPEAARAEIAKLIVLR